MKVIGDYSSVVRPEAPFDARVGLSYSARKSCCNLGASVVLYIFRATKPVVWKAPGPKPCGMSHIVELIC